MTEPPHDQAGHERPDVNDNEAGEPQVVIRLRIPGPVPPKAAPPGATTMRVVTEGAVYEFHAGSMTAVRLRRDGSHLRRDGEPLALLSWPAPVVGRGMELQLLVREDGIPTTRFTSTVRRVER
ncbi:hypothetical protein [Blastococcus sp. CCUG 61487]|uniref:hypothetical protein n=1 Tax=Blastococcus sp. CCUG 61487 TaxID=1840703 RepID=UPI0010C0A91D|nr:hypothetical protein [Blastococcus sp. CCUG 61487]TKJ28476.1 hypothetical protein A6V29_00055 [Blastococcus sp. CCUG 61487]